jgi:hypothetical protein
LSSCKALALGRARWRREVKRFVIKLLTVGHGRSFPFQLNCARCSVPRQSNLTLYLSKTLVVELERQRVAWPERRMRRVCVGTLVRYAQTVRSSWTGDEWLGQPGRGIRRVCTSTRVYHERTFRLRWKGDEWPGPGRRGWGRRRPRSASAPRNCVAKLRARPRLALALRNCGSSCSA